MKYNGVKDFFGCLQSLREEIIKVINNHFQSTSTPIKIGVSMTCFFENATQLEDFKHVIKGKYFVILNNDESVDVVEDMLSSLNKRFENCSELKSGARLVDIKKGTIEKYCFTPTHIGEFLPTPEKLKNKKCIINLPQENEWDHNKCFHYALMVHYHHADIKNGNANKTKRYRTKLKQSTLDFSNISTPVKLNEIPRFEKNNCCSINIFSIQSEGKDSEFVNPYRISQNKTDEQINLLMIVKDGQFHFAYIKSLDRLLNSRDSGCSFTFCKFCLTGYNKRYNGEQKLREHQELCNGLFHPSARVIYPLPGNQTLGFNNFKTMIPGGLILYADFESYMSDPSDEFKDTEKRTVIAKHKPSGYSILPVLHPYLAEIEQVNQKIKPVYYSGKNTMKHFFDDIEDINSKYEEVFEEHCRKEKNLTKEDWKKHNKAETCFICGQSFQEGPPPHVVRTSVTNSHKKYNIAPVGDNTENSETLNFVNSEPTPLPESRGLPPNAKVADHCHISGLFRGSAHAACNLRLRLKKDVPIFFHNLSKYDSHHILRYVGKSDAEIKNIKVLAKTLEKFTGFSFSFEDSSVKFIFKDSLQHLPNSLDKLVQNLLKSSNKDYNLFNETKKLFREYQTEKGVTNESFKLLLQKGVFPYSYFTSLEKLQETDLPDRADFFNDLTKSECSEQDYSHARKVYDHFKCRNLKDYQNLYMRLDVCLLADVFENYRKLSMRNYGLDPTHFFTSPSLSWNACLKTTKVKIDLIVDPEMSNFIDQGFLGGVSFARNPYLKANNPKCPGFNPNLPEKWILLLDANNLYGWAMKQALPMGGFEWVNDLNQFTEQKIKSLSDDSGIGYMFQVDLDYPRDHHHDHSQYPLAPEHMTVDSKDLSAWQLSIMEQQRIPVSKSAKLCLTLKPKHNYVLHYRNLKQYLELGMKLTKIHKCLKFKQSKWMESYIDINTSIRKGGVDKCTKDLAKLFNNSCFGKTCENVWNYNDVKFFTGEEKMDKVQNMINSPYFDGLKLYDEFSAVIKMKKQQVVLDKPRFVGQCVLSLSKIVMYDFHFHFMMKHFKKGLKLGFTDTDSFCYEIEHKGDIYEKLKELDASESIFDFSNYPENHPNYSMKNYLVPGKFKDEGAGVPYCEGIFLRSKMYSLKSVDVHLDKSTAKGIDTCTKNREFTHETYRDALFNSSSNPVSSSRIVNDSHRIYTVKQTKAGLSNFNDKIYLNQLPDGTYDAHPFGFNPL